VEQRAGEPAGEDEPGTRELVEAGADLAGALAGGMVGAIGGPPGIVAGAAAGVIVPRAVRAVAKRFSAREAERAGAALWFIAADADQRRRRGETPRADGFFDEDGRLGADGEELLEGVLRHAAGAYEQRKVRLLANLYSGVAHDASIAPATGQFLVTATAGLTYRQFVALSVFANAEDHQDQLVDIEVRQPVEMVDLDPSIVGELDDLGERRFMGVLQSDGSIVNTADTWGRRPLALPWSELRPSDLGQTLVDLTGAGDIPRPERDEWLAAFDRRRTN
jgi:hypothetical protein